MILTNHTNYTHILKVKWISIRLLSVFIAIELQLSEFFFSNQTKLKSKLQGYYQKNKTIKLLCHMFHLRNNECTDMFSCSIDFLP